MRSGLPGEVLHGVGEKQRRTFIEIAKVTLEYERAT